MDALGALNSAEMAETEGFGSHTDASNWPTDVPSVETGANSTVSAIEIIGTH